ncbi:phenylacetate--CoA ligase family protein [Pseudochelatococcus contaminans]|uniref:Phenylacetate-CoA ligase n=1 Tax=Pseudochelatococcus contaminans TaxID=1538103 RepID=A0A7W5Z3N7_9HYPH|nr:AMP-binding protein [Pseudochelatococcus contaminans]MBB3809399.1 phenylacetate-CoA ligase [Pseudochelatococcus contaminans]
MTAFNHQIETRDPAAREAELFAALPAVLDAARELPAWAERLKDIDSEAVRDRAALARLPVLRKSDLPALHAASLPFGGLLAPPSPIYSRLFASPGPIFEPEVNGRDAWRSARALHAAGFRAGEIVLNTFSYHLTPGGFIFDSGANALDCPVIPAGPGNTDAQLQLIEAYRPAGYTGTPDFLKILLDTARDKGADISSIKKAVVSGAAFPPSLQKEIAERGVEAYQAYATAELGVVAFETPAREGLVVNEGLIVEIVRPGTGDPVPDGEIGEVLVTALDPLHPIIRLALGDLSAILPGASPCGRTNQRIRGWLGRADQTTKIKGMFVRPEQIAEIGRAHPGLGKLRLVVTRDGEADQMMLLAESPISNSADAKALITALAATLHEITKVRGTAEIVGVGELPNDGKVIADERIYT